MSKLSKAIEKLEERIVLIKSEAKDRPELKTHIGYTHYLKGLKDAKKLLSIEVQI